MERGESVQPYYVSRGRGSADSAETTETAETILKRHNARATEDSRPFNMPLLIGLASVLMLAGLASFYWLKGSAKKPLMAQEKIFKASAAEKSIAQPSTPDPRVDELVAIIDPSAPFPASSSKPAAWDGKPFYKGIINQGSRAICVWQFPASMGFQYGRLGIENPDQSWVAMVGPINTPTTAKFCIALQPAILDSLDQIGGFTDGSFNGIRFENSTADQFRKLVAALAKFKSIDRLDFRNLIPDSELEKTVSR